MQAQEIPGGFRSSLNMKRLLLLLLLLLLCGNVVAQPIIRNSFTTNTAGKFPLLLAAPGASSNAYPVVHIDNTGDVLEWPYLYYSSSNAFLNGMLKANSGQFTNSLNLPFGTASTLLSLNASKNAASVANGVGILTNDGSGGFGFTTNIAQDVTINNFTTTNLTVVNTLTVSNIVTTNITVQNNLTTSNFFTINGKNNTLIVTNTIQVSGQYVYPLAAGTGITLTTNTLAAGQTNVTIASTASGGSSGSTNYRSAVIALTMTGTNVDASQIDWLKTNQCYRLGPLTGNAFFGDAVCVNVPNTNDYQWLQLDIIQGTGGNTVTFTNSIFAGVNGTFAITTNANAWDMLSLVNSRQTNGNVAVAPINWLHR